MSDLILSDKEKRLLKLIKNLGKVSIKTIEKELGKEYIGALGNLVGKVVEGRKFHVEGYHKMVKMYFLKEEKQ